MIDNSGDDNIGAHDSDDHDSDDDKTSIVSSDTLKRRLNEVEEAPPAIVLLMGPARYVGKQWLVNSEEMFAGRAFESHVFVEDRSLSKKHGRFITKGSTVFFEDLSSTNGTEINGRKINPREPISLRNNDHIKCGNVIFKYLESGSLEIFANQDTYDRTQIDPLTQIYNKGALEATGEEIIRKAKQTGFNVTVIVFDLDNFKNVNDTFGHQAGDFALKELSSLVQNQVIRSEDFFARFGGEEFCLILSGSSLPRGVEVAERIRSTIENHDFIYNEQKLILTVSVGVAALEPTTNDWKDIFEKADKASYLSKQGGKNRVSTI